MVALTVCHCLTALHQKKTKKLHNSLIVLYVVPVKQIFPTRCVIPKFFNDSHVVNPLPAAPIWCTWAEKKQQTARKQPQNPCHVAIIDALSSRQMIQRDVVKEEQTEICAVSSMRPRWEYSAYETANRNKTVIQPEAAAPEWPPPVVSGVQGYHSSSEFSRSFLLDLIEIACWEINVIDVYVKMQTQAPWVFLFSSQLLQWGWLSTFAVHSKQAIKIMWNASSDGLMALIKCKCMSIK